MILNHGKTEWQLPQLLYADGVMLFAKSEEELQRMHGGSFR